MLSLLFVGLVASPASARDVSFSDNGSYLMAGTKGDKVAVWDTRTWSKVYEQDLSTNLQAISISVDGGEVAVGCGDTVIWWKRDRDGYRRIGERKINANVESLAFSKDGKQLACGTRAGDILILRTSDGALENRLFERGNGIVHVEFSFDGKRLACAGQGWMIFNPRHRTSFASMPLGTNIDDRMALQPGSLLWRDGNYTRAVSFSPKAEMVVGVGHLERVDQGYARRITIRKSSNGSVLKSIRSEDTPFSTVEWSPDEKLIVAGNEDGSVWLWSWKSGGVSKKPCQVGSLNGISLNRSGDWIAVCGEGSDVEVRSLNTWDVLKRLKL